LLKAEYTGRRQPGTVGNGGGASRTLEADGMNDWFDAEGHVERAHEAYEEGRWDDAERALREALSLNPYRAEWHFNLGLTLEQAGRFDDAVRAFTDCHELDKEDPQVLMMIGVNLLRVDKPAQSIEWFQLACKADASAAGPYVHQIEAYTRLGEHEQAELMFYMAQQLNPKDAGAYANLADSLLARALHDKAVWCLREAAHLDPSLPKIHSRLAEAYASTGRTERARQLYLRELRNDPGDIDTLLDLGCLLVEMNRWQDAGEKFRRVLEMESDNTQAHYYLADLAERQGQFESAVEQFSVVLKLDASFVGARRRLAALFLRRATPTAASDLAAARELLSEDVTDYQTDPSRFIPEDLDALGRVLLDAEMPKEAQRVLEALVLQRPLDAQAWHLFSVALYKGEDRVLGTRAGRRALRLDRSHLPALHNLAVAYAAERRWTRARACVRRALKADHDNPGMRRLRIRLGLMRLQHACSQAFKSRTRK
ncbi:MAG TPA: tetratricopeptide repeat protein, partial [Polyangiaceae bacterium]|nr:tetratricopeptide repeat protein [Polyangiaceae bacterium]